MIKSAAIGDPFSDRAKRVQFTLNGVRICANVEPCVALLDTIRDQLQCFGAKRGCDHGQCGACTVLVDGRRINSCLALTVMQEGAEITTVEGLEKGGKLHEAQQAFLDHDAYQCGYCTPGQIMSVVGMLDEPWPSGSESTREAMSGNICRCGAYRNILLAAEEARAKRDSRGEERAGGAP